MSFDQPAHPAQERQDDLAADAAPPATGGFAALGLAPEILRGIAEAGYDEPTEVQARAIPAAIAGGDLLVSSRTGSGKTAAFVLPALQRILEARRDPAKKRERGQPSGPRVLVLAPTRELAMQVSRACQAYGRGLQGLRVATVVGGVPYAAQLRALRGPLDVLIATPGRLIDHIGAGKALMSQVELLVLDEADRMLDMGFIDDIHHVAAQLSPARQTVMFSATFEGNVGHLAQELTREPQRIRVSAPTEAHSQIEQRLHWADNRAHRDALLDQLLTERDLDQCVVFTSTQRDADELADRLAQIGHSVAALHGGMPQGRRNRVLGALRTRQLRVLIATDVAARGIDVPTISHVINYGLPMKAEDYVHRIGRTGRAGRTGIAITLAERRDVPMIRRIERFTTHPIPPSVVAGLEPKLAPPPAGRPGGFREDRGHGGRGGFGGPRGGHGGHHGHGGPRGHHGGAREGFGDRPGFGHRRDGAGGEREGYGDRPGFGHPRPSFGDRPGHGHGRHDGPRGEFRGHGEHRGAGRPEFRQDGPRPPQRGDAPFQRDGQRPFARDERPAFRPDRAPHAERTERTDRAAWGGKRPADPRFDNGPRRPAAGPRAPQGGKRER
jgi:superfamily II DNA/RNA helicase